MAFDFGGPVLLTPFELVGPLRTRLGLATGTLDWRGPFDPAGDPLWRSMVGGEITERDYWHRRAVELSSVAGTGDDVRDLFGALFDADPAELVRPGAVELLRSLKQCGLATAVLTNDLARFHPPSWIAGVDFLSEVDAVVDGSATGVLKPDHGAFALVCAALDVPATDVLFTDDQVHNIEAAAAFGMQVAWFDVTAPEKGLAAVAAAAGL